MLYAVLKTIHLLSIIVWLGGMVFSLFLLPPALAALEGSTRVQLMHRVLGRFFDAVLISATLALATGSWMIGRVAQQTTQAGVKFNMPLEWMVMATLGFVMLAVFAYLRIKLYRALDHAVQAQAWPAAGATLQRIRPWVMLNLVLGVLIVAITLLGATL